jgi:hypothetical protein
VDYFLREIICLVQQVTKLSIEKHLKLNLNVYADMGKSISICAGLSEITEFEAERKQCEKSSVALRSVSKSCRTALNF